MCKIALSATRDSDILSCNVRWLRSDDRKMPESLELSKQVCIFAAENQTDSMNGDNTERIPQESECQNETEYGILERASAFAQRVLEEIEALAGTTSCKSVQLVRLKKWAQENGCWFSDRSQFGEFFDRGSENEVYLSLEVCHRDFRD